MENLSDQKMSPESPVNSPSPQFSNTTTITTTTSTSPPRHQQQQQVIMSPCAACKILRRRCAHKCVLAPYFPPTDPLKFTIAHKVFGASNIIKLLQDLPEAKRADAVSSMVYEANARLRDPVYGSAGAICQLQNQVSELQAELAKAKAEMVNMQCQQANLIALICMEMTSASTQSHHHQQQQQQMTILPSSPQDSSYGFLNFYDDNNNLNSIWEPLWT